TASGISRTVNGRIEYDGLMLLDVTFAPTGHPISINTIKQNVKMPPARALFFSRANATGFTRTYDPLVPTTPGTFHEVKAHPPCPSFILSDDDCGLEWFTENTENWHTHVYDNNTTTYQQLLVDGTGNVVIENSFATKAFHLDRATKISFGLMATPIKEL